MKYEIKATDNGVVHSYQADGIHALHEKLATLKIFGLVITDVSSKRNVLRLRKIKYSL